MSSIDWQKLLSEHDRAPERDDPEWLAALEILDEDPEQQRLAEEADPLMMFRRMRSPRVTGADIESMKAAVHNLRQASQTLADNPPSADLDLDLTLDLESDAERPFSRLRPRLQQAGRSVTRLVSRHQALALAALLVLALSAALVGGLVWDGTDQASQSTVAAGSIEVDTIEVEHLPLGIGGVRGEFRSADRTAEPLDFAAGTVRIDGAMVAASLAAAELPLVEDADPDSDLLMQIEDDDLSLVVVMTGQDV